MKRNYIGLASTFHDSALAIVDSKGDIVFAEATERYLQYKKSLGISPDVFFRIGKLIREYCEPDAELVLAHSWSGNEVAFLRSELAEFEQKEKDVIAHFEGEVPYFIHREMENRKFQLEAFINGLERASATLTYELSREEDLFGTQITTRRYDHHLCHAAASCFSSPFDEAICAIIDGEGEMGRASDLYHYKDGRLERFGDLPRKRNGSLGDFFSLVCQACGFGVLTGEEWKVMGLAPYGKLNEDYYKLLKTVVVPNGLELDGANNAQYSKVLWELYAKQRKPDEHPLVSADLAHTGQRVFSDVVLEHLRNVHGTGVSNNLVLAGGCALNSSVNGQIVNETGFESLFVFCAPADDGNAVGAALLAYYEDHAQSKPSTQVQIPYLGSTMSGVTFDYLKKFGQTDRMQEYPDGAVCDKAAELLAQGKIIGWVQGRAEYGPRALGNRSILADPRSAGIKDEINSRVKFREEFRPFAPSILHEFGPEYFENYQESPYMERTLIFKEAVRDKVPGVVHANGTGRLQSVKKEYNERYWNLINAFYQRTGVPVVLNTSFNIMGKPIIHSVEDAVAVFYTTGLDALIIGDLVIEK